MYIRTYIMAASTGLGKLCTRCDNVMYALNGPCVVRPSQLERCRYHYAVYAVGVHVSMFVYLKLEDGVHSTGVQETACNCTHSPDLVTVGN